MTKHTSWRVVVAIAVVLAGVFAGGPVLAQEPARSPVAIPTHWLPGFARPIAGELLIYPWAYAGQARALLTRTTDGRMRIEWEADAVPPGPPDEPVTLIWHAGMASGYGAHRFTLTLNGTPCATFTSGRTTTDREWTITGAGGCTLAFKTTRIGTFDELFGLMLLTVPRRAILGAPPRIAVTGEAADNRDYYMTFQEPVKSWVRAVAEEARFKDGARVVRVEASHIANPAPMAIRAEGEVLWRGQVESGYSSVLVPIRSARPNLTMAVEVDGRPALSQALELGQVRPWEMHLLPHSHVDVGYSDPQPEVERKQWKNLRDAVALAERTKDYPAEARFRWNVEGLWSVESYLRQASPDERAAFLRAVKQGAIGMQANFTNILTGIATPEELARWTDGARRLEETYGIAPGRSAMHTDIPGLSWTVVSALARAGVRYFSSGPNYMPGLPDRGDRIGHTLKALGDKPFWWVSPSGQERLLFWMAGRGYSWFHGLNLGKAGASAQQPILDYLTELKGAGYPYDLVQVRYTIGGDNGPTDATLPEFVKTWNETFQTPRLVIDTADALFAEMEKRFGDRLPRLAGDMTPYWEDGAVSTAAEEAAVRAAGRRVQTAETLLAMRGAADLPTESIRDAWQNIIMWHEHTWGAAGSISQPDRADVVGQWKYKQQFALEADRLASVVLERARPAAGPLIEVANPSSWPRSGLIVVPEAPAATGGRGPRRRLRAVTVDGTPLPTQRLSDGRLVTRVSSVPPLGALRLRLGAGESKPPARPVKVSGTTIDNGLLRLVIDPSTGAIGSLRASGLPDIEFVAQGQGLNGYLYVPGRDPAKAEVPGSVRITVEDSGPLVATIRVESDAPGTAGLVRRITLEAGSREVAIEDVIEKTLVREKESAHIAFPFNLPGGVIRVDQGEALVAIEKDQLPGACKEFIGVHSAVDLSNDKAGISLLSVDAPLIELGAMTDERPVGEGPRGWRTSVAPGTTVYAYLLNNYWHTNYKADQSGRLTFRFRLRPHGPFDPVPLRRFSAASDHPFLVSPVAAKAPRLRAPFRLEGAGIVLSALRPEPGGGFYARIYNASDKDSEARLVGLAPGTVLTVIDAEGRSRPLGENDLKLPPFGVAALHLRR